LTNILSEIITTVFINLLNGVDWALNLDKNILTAAVFGGVMIVGGIVVAKLMKKFKVTEAIGSVLKKIFGKVDNVIDQTDEVALALAKNADDISNTLAKNANNMADDIVGDLANGVCFIAGTKVATDEGLVNIEEIEVGDRVYATDPENGETALKVVKQTYINVTATLVHIDIQDEKITTTPTHPFYVIGRGWVAAKHLREGDRLLSLNGESVYIEKVSIENLDEAIKVYNLEIEGFHTYHVGQSKILVHNTCRNTVMPDPDAVGMHSTFRLDGNGNISTAKTWNPNPNNPNGFQEIAEIDFFGKAHNGIPTPHVHIPGSKHPISLLEYIRSIGG
jgi:hypothetical protein